MLIPKSVLGTVKSYRLEKKIESVVFLFEWRTLSYVTLIILNKSISLGA